MLVETLTGKRMTLGGVFLFLNVSSHVCCELLPVPTEARHWCSCLFDRYMGWREPDTRLERRPWALWSCPRWAGHCWQAGCSQRSGVSASSCPPVSSSAWPSGWVAGREAGRSLHRSHGSVLLAPIVLPKAWCWSADQKAISQLRVIGAPFSNWAASTHSQSSCCRMGVSSALFLLLFTFYYLNGFAARSNPAIL